MPFWACGFPLNTLKDKLEISQRMGLEETMYFRKRRMFQAKGTASSKAWITWRL